MELSRSDFLVLCLFLFIGCSRQQEELNSQNLQGAQGLSQETQSGPEETKTIAETETQQEKAQETVESMAKTRANPFLTQEEENAVKETGATIPINYLSLSAILYSSKSSRAIINGQILSVGDSIDNKKIIKIEPEAVILKDAQGEYIVSLKKVAGE